MRGVLRQPSVALRPSDAEELNGSGRRRAEHSDRDRRAHGDKQLRNEARPERIHVYLFTTDARDRETFPDLHAHEQTDLGRDEDADQLNATESGEQRCCSPSRSASSPGREDGESNADEDGLDEDGVVEVPEELGARARVLVSVEQEVRDPMTGQRSHKRRPEKQDAPITASYEHGRSIPFDSSSRVRRVGSPPRRPRPVAQRTKAGGRLKPMERGLPTH